MFGETKEERVAANRQLFEASEAGKRRRQDLFDALERHRGEGDSLGAMMNRESTLFPRTAHFRNVQVPRLRQRRQMLIAFCRMVLVQRRISERRNSSTGAIHRQYPNRSPGQHLSWSPTSTRMAQQGRSK